MSLLALASRRFNVHPAIIFKAAFDRNEVYLHPDNSKEVYEDCAITDTFPTIVEDLALDLLSGRVKIIRNKGELNGTVPDSES